VFCCSVIYNFLTMFIHRDENTVGTYHVLCCLIKKIPGEFQLRNILFPYFAFTMFDLRQIRVIERDDLVKN